MEIALKVVPLEGLEALSAFLAPLWHDTYDALIGKPQVDYMLSTMQSPAALREQVTQKHYTYYALVDVVTGEQVGYCGLAQQPPKLFLSKLYLCKHLRGQGLGQKALAQILALAKAQGHTSVYLTVNKGNAPAIRAYEKAGFFRASSAISDIGAGFVMDDYIYEHTL